MLQRVLHKANSTAFTSYYYDLEILSEEVQYDLFHNSFHVGHCLNHFYTEKLRPFGGKRLRVRGHDFKLLTVKYEFSKCNLRFTLLLIMCDSVCFVYIIIFLILVLSLVCCKHVRFSCVINSYLLTLVTTLLHTYLFLP